MRSRGWLRLLALVAAVGLFFAACSTEDDPDEGTSGSSTTEAGEQEAGPATCEGTAGDDPTIEPVGGGEGDGSALRVGMVLDIGGIDDDSFNEAANTGVEAAAEDFGVQTRVIEPNDDGSNRAELLRQLATEGYDLVIGVGFVFAESMGPLAEEFPDVNFVIIDDATLTQPNITPLVFAEEQGSYLVGAAAALASGTGEIGFIGGVETELIQKFQAGFEAGVKATDPDATVDVRYLSQPPDFTGFTDTAAARTAADDMYDSGIDVVYHAAGDAGNGLFESAKGADRLAIGVDSDQYQQVDEATQPCILTSMIKRVDVAVYEAIEDLVNGELEGGTPVEFDLENGIGFSTSGGQVDDIEEQLNDLRQQIIDGEIEVPTTP